MGLLSATMSATKGMLQDQWRDYFHSESMPSDILITRGVNKRGSKKKDSENIISNGSIIAVNDGQAMVIVEQGQIVEFCAEPGEFVYDMSTEPSIFYGDLQSNIVESFKSLGRRIAFGGKAGKDQRVYFFNTKEITGNKYGTPAPVPFRVVDTNIGLDVDIAIRCNGEYSYKVVDPILFYTNVAGNVTREFRRSEIDSQLKTELLTALQPAFAKISAMGIRYSALPGHTMELAQALNEVLSEKWGQMRGLRIVSFGVNAVKASEEDENMIKNLQRTAVFRNANMAAATMVDAQSEAMKSAGKNEGGAMMGFAGLNMAQQAGGLNAQQLFQMGEQQQAQSQQQTQASENAGWKCTCGATNTGKFCSECGTAKPEPKAADGWVCSCGTENKGKFCSDCGKPKPVDDVKCTKCGFEPEGTVPKFCPECGTPFNR